MDEMIFTVTLEDGNSGRHRSYRSVVSALIDYDEALSWHDGRDPENPGIEHAGLETYNDEDEMPSFSCPECVVDGAVFRSALKD